MSASSGRPPRGRGIAIVLNNYLHDLATGVWVSANAFQWAVVRRRRDADGPLDQHAVEELEAVRAVAHISLAWILVAGVVRAITFRRYEWSDAAGRGQLGLLGVKHIFLFSAVLVGWKLGRETNALLASATGEATR